MRTREKFRLGEVPFRRGQAVTLHGRIGVIVEPGDRNSIVHFPDGEFCPGDSSDGYYYVENSLLGEGTGNANSHQPPAGGGRGE